jgi:hypothetical protein
LIDDTDFKTIEGAIAYNAAGMALFWHFCTSAGVYTVTAVTPTTAGVYDWTDQGTAGVYTIEIPASGGASINNDTEGYGWFTGVATGVLPWRGPVIGFRSAALNDSLCDTNTTGLLAPTVAARTLDVTATGAAGIDWANVENPTTALNLSATNIDVDQVVASVSGAVGSVTGNVGGNVVGSVASVTAGVTVSTNNDKTGYGLSAALDTKITAILEDTGTTLPAQISALNNLSAAQVNAEVVDALATDTYAEPGQGAPAATTSLSAKINYIYKFLRNKVTTTATTASVYDDAGTTVDHKSTISDDATTFTRGEYGSGP